MMAITGRFGQDIAAADALTILLGRRLWRGADTLSAIGELQRRRLLGRFRRRHFAAAER